LAESVVVFVLTSIDKRFLVLTLFPSLLQIS
jgi:hypothetical protein